MLFEIVYLKPLCRRFSNRCEVISRKYYPGFSISFFFSFRKCLSRIAKLWCWGWINPIPPWCFGKNSVFLAIGSVLWNCHIYLKMMFSIFCWNVAVIGKTLLKMVTLDKIRELRSMVFPLKERCRLESCCICFLILVRHLSQL